MKKNRMPLVLAGALLLGAGAYTVWRIAPVRSLEPQPRKIRCYQDSMHPWIQSDQPGKCTVCGMDLTPIYEGESGAKLPTDSVVLNSGGVTVLNVQTDEVRRQPLTLTVRVAGTLDADETRTTIFAAPAAGRIESLAVEYAGLEIEEGQRLLTFYSPELIAQRRQYVVRGRSTVSVSQTTPLGIHENEGAIHGRRLSHGAMLAPGLPPVRSEGGSDPYYCDLLAPQSGTVVDRNVFPGQYVAEGDRIFKIVDTSVLWFRFDVYERQLGWLQPGQPMRVIVPAVAGKEFTGVLSWIEPTIDVNTRTAKVRAELSNPKVGPSGREQRLLRLGMSADGFVIAEIPDVLAVPRSAILSPGGRAHAYVEASTGAYTMHELTLGRQGDTHCEVLEGLQEGDRVVTSGNVLIDAQAQFTRNPELPPPLTDPVSARTSSPAFTSPAPVGLALSEHPSLEQRSGTRPALPKPVRSHNNRTPEAMDRMTQVLASRLADQHRAEVTRPMAGHANAVSAGQLTETQRKAAESFLKIADGVSRALAADDLAQFNQQFKSLPVVLQPLQKELAAPNPWQKTIERLAESSRSPAPVKNLAEAREWFLPFSTAAVGLAGELRRGDSAFTRLKIYHCPMAPKPGLWLQSEGPLANPFYGAKMLTCGEEVKP